MEGACLGLIGNRLTQPMVKEKNKILCEQTLQCEGDLGCNPPPRYKNQGKVQGECINHSDGTTSHGSSGRGSALAAGSALSAPCPGQQELFHPSFIPPGEGKGNESCHSQHISVTVAGTAAPSTGTGVAPAGTRRFTPQCAPVFVVSPYATLCFL